MGHPAEDVGRGGDVQEHLVDGAWGTPQPLCYAPGDVVGHGDVGRNGGWSSRRPRCDRVWEKGHHQRRRSTIRVRLSSVCMNNKMMVFFALLMGPACAGIGGVADAVADPLRGRVRRVPPSVRGVASMHMASEPAG